MKTDFSVSFSVPYGTTAAHVTVHGVSTIAAAMLTFYFGQPQQANNEDDTAIMTAQEFKDFKDYCNRASANRFDFIFTLNYYNI